MVYDWRDMMDQYKIDHGGEDRILMTEAYANITFTQLFYGNDKRKGSHLPFNFVLLKDLNKNSNAKDFHEAIHRWIDPLDKKYTPNWLWGNHDNSRSGSVFGEKMINILHTVSMTLPGIAITYNGEEIGMINHDGITWEETQDPQACNKGDLSASRDPERTPFHWDDSKYAGFTWENATKTWLPVQPDYKRINLKQQMNDDESVFKYYQDLVELRKDPIMIHGDFTSKHTDNILFMKRSISELDQYEIILNFNSNTVSLSIETKSYTVILPSPNSLYKKGEVIQDVIEMSPYTALILKMNYSN